MPNIFFTISDEKFAEFEEAFLKECPNPNPLLSSLEWIKEWGRQQYQVAYERGKVRLAQENVVKDSQIIE